jgi:hypothetical protein
MRTLPRLPMPSDTEAFSEETCAAVRHILKTRNSMPPPSSYLTYAGQAGALLSDLVDHLRYHTSLTAAETVCGPDFERPALFAFGLQEERGVANDACRVGGVWETLRAGLV